MSAAKDRVVGSFKTAKPDGVVVTINEWETGRYVPPPTQWDRGPVWKKDSHHTLRTADGLEVQQGADSNTLWIKATNERLIRLP